MALEKENLSRRNFIKNSGLFAGGVVFVSTLSPYKFVFATKKLFTSCIGKLLIS